MRSKYDSAALRSQALLQAKVGVSVFVPPREMLALLDDLELYRHTLERIIAWDYTCRDEWCEAGDEAIKALNR